MALFDLFGIVSVMMISLSLLVILIAICLPSEQRKKVLRHLARKWII